MSAGVFGVWEKSLGAVDHHIDDSDYFLHRDVLHHHSTGLMPAQIAVGKFNKINGDGAQSFPCLDQTGTPFTPVGGLFVCLGALGASGFRAADSILSWGYDDGINARATCPRFGYNYADYSSGLDVAIAVFYSITGSCVIPSHNILDTVSHVPALRGKITGTGLGSCEYSWLTDGPFEHPSDPTFDGMEVAFMLFGGSGVQAYVTSELSSGVAGDQILSCPGFNPTTLLISIAEAAGDIRHSELYYSFNHGWANSVGCQGSIAGYSMNSFPPEVWRKQRSDRCIARLGTGGSSNGQAAIVDFGVNRATINWIEPTTSPIPHMFLTGIDTAMGSFTRPLGIVERRYSQLGIDPIAALLASFGTLPSVDEVTNVRVSVSLATAQSHQALWTGVDETTVPSVTAQYTHTLPVSVVADPPAAILSECDGITFQPDAVDLSWADPVAAAEEYLYALFGTTTTLPLSPCSPTIIDIPVIRGCVIDFPTGVESS